MNLFSALGTAASGYLGGQIKGEQEQFRRQQLKEQSELRKLSIMAQLQRLKVDKDPYKVIREHAGRVALALENELNDTNKQESINSIPGWREHLSARLHAALDAQTAPDPTKWYRTYTKEPEAPPVPGVAETPRDIGAREAMGPDIPELAPGTPGVGPDPLQMEQERWFAQPSPTRNIFSSLSQAPPATPPTPRTQIPQSPEEMAAIAEQGRQGAPTLAAARGIGGVPTVEGRFQQPPAPPPAPEPEFDPLTEIRALHRDIQVLRSNPESVIPRGKGQTDKSYRDVIKNAINEKRAEISSLGPLVTGVVRADTGRRELAAGIPELKARSIAAGTEQKKASTLRTLTLLPVEKRLKEVQAAAIPERVKQGWKRIAQGDRRLTESEQHNLVTEAQGWSRIKDAKRRTDSMVKKADFLINNFPEAELGRNNRALLGAIVSGYNQKMGIAGVINTSKMAGVDDPYTFVNELANKVGLRTGSAPAAPATGTSTNTTTRATTTTTRGAAGGGGWPKVPGLTPAHQAAFDSLIDAGRMQEALDSAEAQDPNVRKAIKRRYHQKYGKPYGQ